ncbi:MAG: hypothetical protein MHM6MM_000419 [Cercozoa sp. M6MM]
MTDEESAASNEPDNVQKRQSSSRIVAASLEMKNQMELDQRKPEKSKSADAEESKTRAYDTNAHRMTLDELAEEYQCNLTDGLDEKKVEEVRAIWGENRLTPKAGKNAFIKWAEQVFGGFFNVLLWVGSVISIVAYIIDENKDKSNLYIGIVLAIVVLITGTFSYFQESKSDAIMESFKAMAPEAVSVIRDNGTQKLMDPSCLVPGDLVEIKAGDRLPADMRVIESYDMKVNNSSLTGEPDALLRTVEMTDELPMETGNLAFFGTTCENGRGRGIIINTGDNTLMGRIAKFADDAQAAETPINREIRLFVLRISGVAIFLGVLFLIIGFAIGNSWIDNIIFIIGIIVANVPEGLLATVTVSLTLTAQRMAHKQVLVKNLEAVETLGSTSVICSDKTGTLTRNVMTVAHCFYNVTPFECDTSGGDKGTFDTSDESFRRLVRVSSLCNNAKYTDEGKIVGDASETALLKFSTPQLNNDVQGYRARHPELHSIPFNSRNKWQISVHVNPDAENAPLIVCKGAPDKVLDYCDRYLLNGEYVPITEEIKEQVRAGILGFGAQGERVLGMCELQLSKDEYPEDYVFSGAERDEVNFPFGRDGEAGLVFVGLMAMIDPPRPGVPEAVRKCQTAGIKVFMVTGDHPVTAKAIARQVGIIRHKTADDIAQERGIALEEVDDDEVEAVVLHGQTDLDPVFDKTPDEITEFWNRVLNKQSVVFARTSPQQKLLIVQACQLRGGVVAVTGDGVNDSPALKKAHIGVAMGKVGTAVAKDAADMILLDDNFASIVNGVEEGRIIFDNLKKSIAYTLSSNIPEIIPFLLFVVMGIPLPLTTVMILMVDLGTDLVPAISFAHEKKEADIMKRAPRNKDTDNLVTWRLISFSYLQIGVIQALAGLFTYMVVLFDEMRLRPSQLTGLVSSDNWSPPGLSERSEFTWLMCYKDSGVLPKKFTQAELYGGIDLATTPITLGDFSFRADVDGDGNVKYASPGGDAEGNSYCTYVPFAMRCEGDYAEFGCKTGELIDVDDEDVVEKMQDLLAPSLMEHYRANIVDVDMEKLLDRDDFVIANWWERDEKLAKANTAYFLSIIVVQWADLLICKTRSRSLLHQGMKNRFMNFGLLFETVLGILLIYTPANVLFGTRPVKFIHWFPGMPFSMFIFLYDEFRKWWIRDHPGQWLHATTYW